MTAARAVEAVAHPSTPEQRSFGFRGVSSEDFKRAFRNHPAGVAIITADAGEGPSGLTATSVFSAASPLVYHNRT